MITIISYRASDATLSQRRAGDSAVSLSAPTASADSHLLPQSSNAQNATPTALSLSFLLLLLHGGLLVFKLFKICKKKKKKLKLGCWFVEVHSQCFSPASDAAPFDSNTKYNLQ